MAGRPVGYPQALLGLGGMALTLLFGVRFLYWSFANWSRLHGPQTDPLAALGEMWLVLRWALLGIGVFLLGWFWALATSLQLVSAAKSREAANVPPRLS
jgi:hypothetical protein